MAHRGRVPRAFISCLLTISFIATAALQSIPARAPGNLRNGFLDNPPRDIRQTEITPLKLHCQPRVVEAE